jgi:hypothetical protein
MYDPRSEAPELGSMAAEEREEAGRAAEPPVTGRYCGRGGGGGRMRSQDIRSCEQARSVDGLG